MATALAPLGIKDNFSSYWLCYDLFNSHIRSSGLLLKSLGNWKNLYGENSHINVVQGTDTQLIQEED